MSKNFPHDNIYSILGKLEALQPTTQEQHDAKVQEIRESVEAQGSILKGLREVSSTEAKLRKEFAESEKWIQKTGVAKHKGDLHKALHVPQGEKIPKAKIEKASHSKNAHLRHMAQFAKNVAHEGMEEQNMGPGTGGMEEGEMTEVTAPGQEAWVKKNKQHFIDQYGKEKGLEVLYATAWKRHHAANEDIASMGTGYGTTAGVVEEETCNECGMWESKCSCDHSMKEDPMGDSDGGTVWEGEVTRKPGVTTHRKTDFPGYPSSDLEKDDDETDAPKSKGGKGRPRKATTVNPRRDPNAPKKGRGRPAKTPVGGAMGKLPADPFGRISGKAPKGKTGRVHSMMESVNFKRMMEEQHMTLDEMLECMNADMQQFKETGVCSDRLRDMMEVYSHAKRQMEETQGGIGHDLVTPQQRVAQATPPKPGMMGAVKDIAQGAKNWIQGKPEQGPTYEDAALEEELNELAKLAGITDEGNKFTGKLKSTPKGGKFELDGKEFTDTSELDEADAPVDDNTSDQDPINNPKEKYMSMKASTLNPGEGDFGEKQMNPDRPTFKNGDNAMSRPPVRENAFKLEAKLAAEYESIKKSS